MTQKIYNSKIEDHYYNPRHRGLLENPDKTIKTSNQACGDSIEWFVRITNNHITDISYQAVGCMLSCASASILAEYVVQKNQEDIRAFTEKEFLDLVGLPTLGAQRSQCVLLALNALKKCLGV